MPYKNYKKNLIEKLVENIKEELVEKDVIIYESVFRSNTLANSDTLIR
jgi:hypothetical protein